MKNFCVAYQPLSRSFTESFLAHIFCFPNSDHVIFSRELPFLFSLIFHNFFFLLRNVLDAQADDI